MVSDMDPDLKTCAIVSRSQRGEHFKEIIEGIILPGNDASGTFGTGELGQHLGDIIGHRAVLDVSAAKDVAHQNVEVKTGGDAKTAATFEQRAKKCFVVKNHVAGFFVREEFYQAIGSFDFVSQNGENEVDIFGSELNSAVRLDDIHHRDSTFANVISFLNSLRQAYSIIGSMQLPYYPQTFGSSLLAAT